MANDLVATVNSLFELAVGFTEWQPTTHDHRKKRGDCGYRNQPPSLASTWTRTGISGSQFATNLRPTNSADHRFDDMKPFVENDAVGILARFQASFSISYFQKSRRIDCRHRHCLAA